jgi:hypothetical protein
MLNRSALDRPNRVPAVFPVGHWRRLLLRMKRFRRANLLILASALVLLVMSLVWHFRSTAHRATASASTASMPATTPAGIPADVNSSESDSVPTNVYAHNLLLRKGPDFRIYIPWFRGQMVRTHRNVVPSFDDVDSFVLDVKSGIIHANIGDIGDYLNLSETGNSSLKKITLSGDGNRIRIRGTMHKVISLPVEILGTIAPAPDGRIQMHVTKLNVLKIPLKGLLGGLHVSVSDLFGARGIPSIQVSGNDIFFDTQKLLPPPHIRGELTAVRVANPDLEAVYGNAENAVARVEQWRNFLRLRDGALNFGKLTMNHVDLIMIDISNDAWFDLDLAHYQEQLVNGYTRLTPQAGLQIFMPDVSQLAHKKSNQNISLEWLKNRNLSPPPEVTPK